MFYNFLYLILCSYTAGNVQQKLNYDLKVEITGIENIEGDLKVAIYDIKGANEYTRKGFARLELKHKVSSKTEIVLFKNLPAGKYAVSLYHDINSDGKLNTTFIGLPDEPYGFSENFVPVISGPDWEDCVFEINKDTHKSIKLLNT